MNAPEIKVLGHSIPQCLLRRQPARFGWWSDHSLVIAKGDETITLDADDIRALARFVEGCNAVEQV